MIELIKVKSVDPSTPGSLASVRRRSASGLSVTFAAQAIKLVTNFAFQVLLARLLFPQDFGLVAMAAPLFSVANLLTDMGLTQITVQRDKIDDQLVSEIYWVNLLTGSMIALMLAASAPAAVAFYEDNRLAGVIYALSALLVLNCSYGQHLTILARRLAFGRLALIDLASLIPGWTAALVVAVHHGGYWAIVANQIGSSLAAGALAVILSGWSPRVIKDFRNLKGMIGFGANVTGASFANFVSGNLDNVLIGKFLGEEKLGLYDRGYKLLLLPATQVMGPLGKIAGPLLARTRHDRLAYTRAYIRMTDVAAMLIYPGVLYAVVFSRGIIPLMLGPRWTDVTPIFQVLAIGALLTPLYSSLSWAFISQGRTAELRSVAIGRAIALSLGFAGSVRFGVVPVAWCFVTVSGALLPLVLWRATMSGPLLQRQVFRSLRSQLTAIIVVVAAEAILRLTSIDPVVKLISGVAVAYPAYIAGLLSNHSGREALLDLAQQCAELGDRAVTMIAQMRLARR